MALCHWYALLIFGWIGTSHGNQPHDLDLSDNFSIKFPSVFDFQNDLATLVPIGHLQNFGNQRPPVGQIPEYFEEPSPRFLWNNHVKVYRPAVFRGLLKGSPALHLWNDKYLTKEYGNLEVLVEKKYEDRQTEPKRMTIDGFLQNYEKRNWYVVSVLPNAMKKDIKLPKPLTCSSLRSNLQELNLWIGTRGTRSMLHYDADNILHCLVSGRKDWILVHPDYKQISNMVMGNPGQGSGYSILDVDSINMYNNPDVANIPWEYATINAGDCLYLPPQYLHQVRSYNRSLSTTFLFFPHTVFTDEDCVNYDLEKYHSLDEVYVYWGYEKGQETVDMGYRNPLDTKQQIMEITEILHLYPIKWKSFLYIYAILNFEIMSKEATIRKTFNAFDANLDGMITSDELANADMEVWKEICRDTDSTHGPTKTAMHHDEKLSNLTTTFNPRAHSHYFESYRTLTFLHLCVEKYGNKKAITFYRFKNITVVDHGSLSAAFLLIDSNMDGVITLNEINNSPKEKLKLFYRMGYHLSNDTVGDSNDDNDDDEITEILTSIHKIFDSALMIMEMSDEKKFGEDEFCYLFQNIKHNGNQVKTDAAFIFKIMDKDNNGYLAPKDVEICLHDDEHTGNSGNVDSTYEGINVARKQVEQKPTSFSKSFHIMLEAILLVNINVGIPSDDGIAVNHDEL